MRAVIKNTVPRLAAKTMLRSVAFLHRPFHGMFHFIFVVAIAHGSIRITIPQKSADKPNEQHQWHYYGHDHVPDFIAQVHKHTNNIKCFGQSKNADYTLNEKVYPWCHAWHGIHEQAKAQFNHCDDQ